MGESQFDASQNQPQSREDDLLLGIEVMRHHARGVAGRLSDVGDRRMRESTARNRLTGDQGDLVAASGMIDEFGQVLIPVARLTY